MKQDKKQKKNSPAKNVAIWGALIALAMIFSYVEHLIPLGELIAIPGVKLGLANVVVLFALYSLKPTDAITIGILRVLLSSFIFGMTVLPYSLAGCVLSFLVMLLAKKTKLSIVGVSMLGGISHNIGQLIVAILITSTVRIAYYLPVLLISGLVTGLLMGFAANLVVKRVDTIKRSTK